MTEPDFLRTTRASYDAVAADYAERFRGELASKPLERALLAGFAELVRAAGNGSVADLGCGPGRVTAHLHSLGLDTFGIDLSPKMIAVARQAHPDLPFYEGTMTSLDLPDASLGGIVAWYSVIHIPDGRLPAVFAEFHRVLAPGGHLALAFQVGEDHTHLAEAFGHPVSLDFHSRQPDRVTELLERAGLELRARMVREPDEDGDFPEKTQRGYLLARRPLPRP
ncbi:class I SAM-dependent methyltransferase [Streptomyces sodiiphilus]|uniref:Class I SAM-dependent methyltransferase n=1 Tax=Streptomyces sodiiphilus TaxID=226217 RepID=A0ABP5A9B5_9ACTN